MDEKEEALDIAIKRYKPLDIYSRDDLRIIFGYFIEGYTEKDSRKTDPWDMVPEEPVNGESERNLIVATNGMWAIISSVGTRRKVINTIASGYNCDVSRDREIRVCRDGKWIDE